MLQLRAYVNPDQAGALAQRLTETVGVRHLMVGGRTSQNLVQLTGELDDDDADRVLDVLAQCDLRPEDIVLWRTGSTVQPVEWPRERPRMARQSVLWAEVDDRARRNARPALLYVVYMSAAGVVAGVGVLDGSAILVVGAMALSPDLLPLSAAAIGLVERRWALFVRAIATLSIGLAIATFTASASTILLRVVGRIDGGLELSDSALGASLTEIGPGAVLVALAAGMAGILAYETAGRAAVGVAISVTTIPAAAYVGCSLGLAPDGGGGGGPGALAVLITNVVCMVTAASMTLVIQRRWRRTASTSG